MTNSNKSLEKIILKGKKDKLSIDKRIKEAINKVGRADYQFLHNNCRVRKQTYSNGRIKSMIIEFMGHKLLINPDEKKQQNINNQFSQEKMDAAEKAFNNRNNRQVIDRTNQNNNLQNNNN